MRGADYEEDRVAPARASHGLYGLRPGLRRSVGTSGGSRGAGGYNFQAQATAFVYAHVLACRPLTWLPGASPMPMNVASETGGPGDDIRIECRDDIAVEIQVKGGLRRTEELWEAVLRLVHGLDDNPCLYGVLLVNSEASGTVKNDLREDVPKVAYGAAEGLKDITIELLGRLDEAGLTDHSVLRRFAIRVRDFYKGSNGYENAMLMLSGVAENTEAAWAVLVTDGYESMENRSRRDAEALANLVDRPAVLLRGEAPAPQEAHRVSEVHFGRGPEAPGGVGRRDCRRGLPRGRHEARPHRPVGGVIFGTGGASERVRNPI